MEISPRAKLEEEEKRLLHATIASFKVARFCRLLAHTHEEAVLEDEEAKHIERMMMMRCLSRLYEWRKGLVIFRKKRETNKRKKETRRNEDDKNDSEGQKRVSPSHFWWGFGV
jgi:hypothetical protein